MPSWPPTPSALLMVQLEDVAGVVAQANMPGTVDQHPNWRRKLPEPVAVLANGDGMRGLGEALRAARPRRIDAGEGESPGLQTRVPRATYRLQFHKDFGFDDAIRVLPYLAKLGVSHVYCSPIQRARPGSMHGYDVVAHAEVNPELGGEEGFARFVAALKANGLGQLLDMVPNHMGVFGADNAWWMDVLENGPASLFAQHFDIDWHPLNVELTGKVLLPVLGVHYGEALDNGELVLRFEDARAAASLSPITTIGFRLRRRAIRWCWSGRSRGWAMRRPRRSLPAFRRRSGTCRRGTRAIRRRRPNACATRNCSRPGSRASRSAIRRLPRHSSLRWPS
jgi:(1->4)-alpha-D-glucan 1-alpha-D-glucosylmutase